MSTGHPIMHPVGRTLGIAFGLPAAARLFAFRVLTNGGASPQFSPTYTHNVNGGPSVFWVPDDTGVYQNVGGLANSLGQRIPPIAGARYATTIADGAVLGSEVITVAADREFSSDTGFWQKQTGWSISGGKATQSGTAYAALSVNSAVAATVVGRWIQITYTITDITPGALVRWATGGGTGTSIGTNKTAIGTYTDTIFCSGAIYTNTGAAFGYSIDNVSIKEVMTVPLTTSSLGAPLTGMQMVLQPAVTNKVTCRKRNPIDLTNVTKAGDAASTLTVVADVAALAAAGLANICSSGNVYKLDNSAGTGVAYANFAGVSNANPHSMSVWARGGTGGLRWSSGVSDLATFGASASYVRRLNENVAPDTNQSMMVQADAGQTIYFILPSLTETMAATAYPMVDFTDAAAAVTFTATDLSYPNPLPVNNWQWRTKVKIDGTPATDMWLWSDGTIGCYYRASDSKFYYRGETYGAELLSTAVQQFDSGWSVTGEATVSGGVGRLLSTGALSQLYVSVAPLTIGKTYKLTYTITGTPTGDVKDGNGVTMPKAVGVNTWVFTAASTSLALTRVAACDISFTDISAKEVKEISTAAISVGNTYDIGINQAASGASISLNQVVTSDATMTSDHTPGATLSIGEKGDNTLYFRGRLQQQANNDFFAFADQSLQGWYMEDI